MLTIARLVQPSAGLGNRCGSGGPSVGQLFSLHRTRCLWTLLLRCISWGIRHLRLTVRSINKDKP